MRSGLCAILCLAVSASSVLAQTFDKAKLRQAIEMPAISTTVGVHFKSQERDGKGNKFDPLQKIADLQKKLNGSVDDAEIYLEQSAVYLECMTNSAKSKELVARAEAVLRPHMQTSDAKQGHLLTVYGTILESMSDNPWSDCEKWARRAVSIAPQDWRGWGYLAHTRHQQIPLVLVGGNDKDLPKERRSQEIIGMLYLRRLRAEHVDEAEKVLNETLQYHDKAKELAPNDARRQEKRYGFRLTEIMLRNAIAHYRGQKPAYPLVQIERVLLDELQATAKLQPDHLLWQSQLAHQLIIAGWQLNKDKDGKPLKTFRPARTEDEAAIRDALNRIEALAREGKGETATYCYSMLAALCSSMQDNAGAEKHARKILELEPKNQLAAEQLQQALSLQGRHADQLQAAQILAQAVPAPRNFFLLAKALVLNQRPDLAESACQAGLKIEPGNVHCLLGVAALAMRRGGDENSVKVAREYLDKARRECRPEVGVAAFMELEYLNAIQEALNGDGLFARLTLEQMKRDNPDAPRYEKALSAIGG